MKFVEYIRTDQGKVLDQRYLICPNSILGLGTFSKVKRCIRLSDKADFAVKVVYDLRLKKSRSFQSPSLYEKFLTEIQVWSEVSKSRSKNIVNLHEVLQCRGSGNDLKYYMIMDFLEYGACMLEEKNDRYKLPLKTQLPNNGKTYTEESAKKIIKAVGKALVKIHGNGFCHRDIKPSNIMIGDNEIALGDFSESCTLANVKGTCGTYAFLPPEQVSFNKNCRIDAEAADIWALGVTLYCILFGELPFKGDSLVDLFNSIAENKISMMRIHSLTPGCQNCLMKMLETEPNRRISLSKLMDHPWLEEK